jgi:hypothetical protein
MKVDKPFRLTILKKSGNFVHFDKKSFDCDKAGKLASQAENQNTPFRLMIVRAVKSTT